MIDPKSLVINIEQLAGEIEELAHYSSDPAPAVTRVVFSEQDMQARAWFKSLCLEAGLVLREDAVGNIFARWQGTNPDLPAVGTGSHTDAVPCSGKYDGVVGVLGGLEAIRALRRSGFVPRRSIELLMFTSEEPTRFGIGCLGSRLLTGAASVSVDSELKDSHGETLRSVREQAGYFGSLADVRLSEEYYSAFLELHTEQGPLLESSQKAIGVVSGIAAPAAFILTIVGESGHAGSTLMPDRRDAFCAAAEVVLAVESFAKSSGASDTVATVGTCQILPGAANSIPGRVELTVDLRDTIEARRDHILRQITDASGEIATRRGVRIEIRLINADAPAQCSAAIVAAILEACRAQGIAHRPMISRAYHDSLFMARIVPVGMIFIPCHRGISHRPDEYASSVDISTGARTLAYTLALLSAQAS